MFLSTLTGLLSFPLWKVKLCVYLPILAPPPPLVRKDIQNDTHRTQYFYIKDASELEYSFVLVKDATIRNSLKIYSLFKISNLIKVTTKYYWIESVYSQNRIVLRRDLYILYDCHGFLFLIKLYNVNFKKEEASKWVLFLLILYYKSSNQLKARLILQLQQNN